MSVVSMHSRHKYPDFCFLSLSSKPRNEGNRRVSESQEQGEVITQSIQEWKS